jgi:hypothetical protein
MTQEVAIEARVDVGRILQPLELLGASPLLELGASELQQRAREPAAAEDLDGGHATEAAQPGAAQQRHQHRLQLIVGVMRGQQDFVRLQDFPERRVARVASGRLDAHLCACRDADDQWDELDLERLRNPAAPPAPARRIGMQLMIDMRGAHAVVRAVRDGAGDSVQ